MKKRSMVLLLVVSLCVSLFVGCNKDEKEVTPDVTTQTEETKAETEETKAETEVVETETPDEPTIDTKVLTVLASQDWIQEAEIELGAKFEEETGIRVDYQIIPSDQYFNNLLTKLNTSDELDIFMSQSGQFDIQSQLDITKNGVALTNESWASSFDSLAAEQASVDGELYGQTIADIYSVWTVAYNKKLFSELGLTVPKSFEEFKKVCQAIADSGVTPIYECVADGWHHQLWWHEVGPQYETLESGIFDALNMNEKNLVDFQGPKKTLEQIKEMVDLGFWGEDYMSNQFANAASSVASGDYAMTIAQQNFGGDVEAQALGLTAEDIGYFIIPLLDSQTINLNPAGPTRFIYSGSENIEASKLYLEFVARTENLQYILDNSERYSNLPFTGLKNKYTASIQEFFDMYSTSGTVLQTAVKYINPQWMDTGADIAAFLFGDSSAEDVLKNVDKRRADQANGASDPSWK